MRKDTKQLMLWVVVLLIVGVGAYFFISYQDSSVVIRNFEDCVRAGNMVINSVPRRCEITKDQFIVDITEIQKGSFGENGACGSYTFDSYVVNNSIKNTNKPNYDSYPDSKQKSNIIDEVASRGPNFSGSYVVASWDCGVNCQESAIIDGKSGNILIYGIASKYGIDIQKNSSLFIVNPKKNIPDTISPEERVEVITSYYTLEKNVLSLLCREKNN